ncbi:wax synthase family protein [Aspergillus foveolatus]|uniref:wax synthase family protein n=1 Tax=Aspergillus foveolatus TaxID=210207 RepID=UPI003CCD9A6F
MAPRLAIPPWLTPLTSWTLIQTLTSLTVTFTPSASSLRYVAAAMTALCAYIFQTSIQTHYSGAPASGPLVAMCWVNVLNAIDLLVLSRASFDAYFSYRRSKEEKKDSLRSSTEDSTKDRLLLALTLPYNYRRINTPWQLSRLPVLTPSSFPSSLTVNNRRKFLLHSTVKLILAIVIMHIPLLDPSDPVVLQAVSQLDRSKSVLLLPLRAFTQKDGLHTLWLQARFTLAFGIVVRATIVAAYTAGSIFAVMLGGDPAEWPPVAGSLSEAWTLSRLWGQAWHQTLRQPLASNATFLAALAGFAPKSTGAHWIRVLITFVESGVVHSACDMGFGIPFGESGGVAFFSLQILGLLLESVCQSIAARVGLRTGPSFSRAVGYIWVSVFMLWTAPVWANPILVNLASDGVKVMSPWLGFPAGSF